MKLYFIIFACLFFMRMEVMGQVSGCTDPQALNFNASATLNDGSCTYAPQTYTPAQTVTLPAALIELSGMVYWKGQFWGHNDGGGGAWFYAFDTANGNIKKVIGLTGAANADWEDMAQDSLNFYIGDFGNNGNGNRKNLRIYVVPKEFVTGSGDTIRLDNSKYKLIQFSYPDQVDFAPTGANNTRFDCEAMFFHRGRLHLFTKNWIGNFSVHYSLPILPGTYAATRHDSLQTGEFMITAADIGAEDQLILTSYSRAGSCSFFMVYGFDGSPDYFNTGNKRRISLPSSLQIGQLEAVCYINGIRGATGSEKFQVSIFNVEQNTRRFTTQQWVLDHYKHNTVSYAEPGMMRYNSETNAFEYFDGISWQILEGE